MRLVGIDGGGTKTAFVLCSADGTVLNQITGPSMNINQIRDSSLFSEKLEFCIRQLLGEDDGSDIALFGGFAGAATGNNAEIIRNALLTSLPKARISCSGDFENALTLGFYDNDGIVVIAGTGSGTFVRKEGVTNRIGGWGYLIDPAGSAFTIARDAIYYWLRSKDGRSEVSILTEELSRKCGEDLNDVFLKIYSEGPSYVASFAPAVFEAYKKGDTNAKKIIQRNCKYIAEMIIAALENFPDKEMTACLTGSLFKSSDILLPLIRESLGNKHVGLSVLKDPQVLGSVRKALYLSEEKTDQATFDNNFRKTYKEEKNA